MPVCKRCGKKVSSFTISHDGLCNRCYGIELDNREKEKAAEELGVLEEFKADEAAVARIILTTETAHNLPVTGRLGIVTSEYVLGLNLFKDVASSFRDVFGGRSQTMQNGLRVARESALDELRKEAHALGADAVVGIDLDYSEISGASKSMLFLVASGTAVKLSSHPDP